MKSGSGGERPGGADGEDMTMTPCKMDMGAELVAADRLDADGSPAYGLEEVPIRERSREGARRELRMGEEATGG
eukprot:2218193-Pyramimonas_sp.AAC.1